MMNNILEYLGYWARVEFSVEDNVLHGKIEGIDDLITFESDSATTIAEEFKEAVDDYISFCEEVGKEPCKAYKGSFNVRVSPELHKKAAMRAFKEDLSLNQLVEKSISAYVTEEKSLGDVLTRWASFLSAVGAKKNYSFETVGNRTVFSPSQKWMGA